MFVELLPLYTVMSLVVMSLKTGNTGMDSGVQVKAELFGKTNMERGLGFKYRTEKDGECLQPSRNVTGLLQMPRGTVLTPLVGSYLNSLHLNPQTWLIIQWSLFGQVVVH